jgi:hypothetical protein
MPREAPDMFREALGMPSEALGMSSVNPSFKRARIAALQ